MKCDGVMGLLSDRKRVVSGDYFVLVGRLFGFSFRPFPLRAGEGEDGSNSGLGVGN